MRLNTMPLYKFFQPLSRLVRWFYIQYDCYSSSIVYSSVRSKKHNPQKSVSALLLAINQSELRKNTEDIVDIFIEKNIDVYIINNQILEKKSKIPIAQASYLEHLEYGMDFASYKIAIDSFINIDHYKTIYLLNDSVFCEPQLFKNFLSEILDNTDDVLGATLSDEYFPHIQSYFFKINFKSKMIKKDFISFFQKFKFYKCRENVISYGEIAFSRWMSRNYKIKSFFNIDKLKISEKDLKRKYIKSPVHAFPFTLAEINFPFIKLRLYKDGLIDMQEVNQLASYYDQSSMGNLRGLLINYSKSR